MVCVTAQAAFIPFSCILVLFYCAALSSSPDDKDTIANRALTTNTTSSAPALATDTSTKSVKLDTPTESPKLAVTKTKEEPIPLLSPLDQEVIALFDEFNDPKSTISWTSFALKMAEALRKDPKYSLAATTFQDLSQSTWAIKILWKLSSLKKYLPSNVAEKFKGYSQNNFRTMLNKRLALNSPPTAITKSE